MTVLREHEIVAGPEQKLAGSIGYGLGEFDASISVFRKRPNELQA